MYDRTWFYSPQYLWPVLNINSMLMSPGVAKVVFIILLIPIYPGDVSQRGHKSILPSSTDEDTSILIVWIKLSQKGVHHLGENFNEHTHVTLHLKLRWTRRKSESRIVILKEAFCTNWPKGDMLYSSERGREAGNTGEGKKARGWKKREKLRKLSFQIQHSTELRHQEFELLPVWSCYVHTPWSDYKTNLLCQRKHSLCL